MTLPVTIRRLSTLLFSLLLATTVLAGCASMSGQLHAYPANPALARRLSRSQRNDPTLQRVAITFQTLGHGKKATSGIWILAVDNTWNHTLVRATNLARTQYMDNAQEVQRAYFAPYSIHTLDLPFSRSRLAYGLFASDRDSAHLLERIPPSQQRIWRKSNCRHLYFKIGLMARSALLGTTGNTFGFDSQRTFSGYGGHDKWTFNVFLTLYFNDGSKLVYVRRGLSLDSHNGRLVFTNTRS